MRSEPCLSPTVKVCGLSGQPSTGATSLGCGSTSVVQPWDDDASTRGVGLRAGGRFRAGGCAVASIGRVGDACGGDEFGGRFGGREGDCARQRVRRGRRRVRRRRRASAAAARAATAAASPAGRRRVRRRRRPVRRQRVRRGRRRVRRRRRPVQRRRVQRRRGRRRRRSIASRAGRPTPGRRRSRTPHWRRSRTPRHCRHCGWSGPSTRRRPGSDRDTAASTWLRPTGAVGTRGCRRAWCSSPAQWPGVGGRRAARGRRQHRVRTDPTDRCQPVRWSGAARCSDVARRRTEAVRPGSCLHWGARRGADVPRSAAAASPARTGPAASVAAVASAQARGCAWS